MTESTHSEPVHETSVVGIMLALPIGLLGGGIGGLIDAITEAIWGIFQSVLEALTSVFAELGELIIDVALYTPKPTTEDGDPAIVSAPAEDSLWFEVWTFYWGRMLIGAIFIGLGIYVLMNAFGTIPYISNSYQQKLRGGLFRLIAGLILGWPVLVILLFLIDGVNQLVAPSAERFGDLLQVVGLLVAAAALGPQVKITAIVGLINLKLTLIFLALALIRILYLIVFVAISPLLIMAYTLRIPVLQGLAKTLFSVWIKLALAPMVISIAFTVATWMFTEPDPNGTGICEECDYKYSAPSFFDFAGSDFASALVGLVLMLIIPVIGIAGYGIVLFSSAPSSVTRGAMLATGGVGAAGGIGGGKKLKDYGYKTDSGGRFKTDESGNRIKTGYRKKWESAKQKWGSGAATIRRSARNNNAATVVDRELKNVPGIGTESDYGPDMAKGEYGNRARRAAGKTIPRWLGQKTGKMENQFSRAPRKGAYRAGRGYGWWKSRGKNGGPSPNAPPDEGSAKRNGGTTTTSGGASTLPVTPGSGRDSDKNSRLVGNEVENTFDRGQPNSRAGTSGTTDVNVDVDVDIDGDGAASTQTQTSVSSGGQAKTNFDSAAEAAKSFVNDPSAWQDRAVASAVTKDGAVDPDKSIYDVRDVGPKNDLGLNAADEPDMFENNYVSGEEIREQLDQDDNV